MAIQIKGLDSTGGNVLEVDSSGNVIAQLGVPIWALSGGCFSVTGQLSGVVAAALAAGTTLASIRFATTSLKKAYVTKLRVTTAGATFGAVATIPGAFSLQRFSGGTPTGGTARTVNRQSEGLGSGSDMIDVRDSNAALATTGVSGGTTISSVLVPLFLTGGTAIDEWITEPNSMAPIVLNPGDGLWLRTTTVMPATQTWVFSYTFYWYEK